MSSIVMSSRAYRAHKALDRLYVSAPEYRRQAYDEWLGVATPGEVRRHGRRWMGAFPPWAEFETAKIKEGKK